MLLIIGFCLINFASCLIPGSENRVCKTAGCIEAASKVRENIDTTVNPCNNFYQFACGTYRKEKVIRDDEDSINLFVEANDEVQQQLKKIIEKKLNESDPETFKLLQSTYKICLDTDKLNKTGNDEVKAILKQLGDWPVVAGKSWNKSSFNWQKLVYQLRKNGYEGAMNSLLNFDVNIDLKNTSRFQIILNVAETGENQGYLSNGLKDEIVQAYYKYMVNVALILGAERKQAEKELAESLNFEIDLAKISIAAEQSRNNSEQYNLMTVKQLQAKYPYIPWLVYMNKILSPKSYVNLTDQVNVAVPRFFELLPKLIAKTPKRVMANYMIWRVVQDSADFMNDEVRKIQTQYTASSTGTTVQQPRWQFCLNYLSNTLPQAIGALYARKSFKKDTKRSAQILSNDIRKSFYSMLEKNDWMDEKTKKAALMKLHATQEFVAYPYEFFHNAILDKKFGNVKINSSSFLKSDIQISLFDLDERMEKLRKPVNKNSWMTHGASAMVNTLTRLTQNSIEIPAGILHGQFYTIDRPNYMNYGAIGWLIGHEFTHGFDDQGSQFDKDGNLINWWSNQTKTEFLKRTQCIIDQYSNYTVPEVGLNIDGINTQGENIADNGGIKEAYLAYEEFVRQNGEEPHLPNLPYSPRQIFWISAANIWCDKSRPEFLKNVILTDVHSPEEFRVIGSFSNMPQFAKDFKCPLESPMNPVNKCAVW